MQPNDVLLCPIRLFDFSSFTDDYLYVGDSVMGQPLLIWRS